MDIRYSVRRKSNNIRSINLPKKENYYVDLINIEHSWSGRSDIFNIGNQFIMEAVQQLINAMELFEQGYFDCAYYSIRSAVDLSTTIVFLSDMPDREREIFLDAWKETKDFPMQGQMIKQLVAKGYIISDMKDKMADFFTEAKKFSEILNKYVHKQGLRHFYVSRNHPFNRSKSQDTFINNFDYHLRSAISVVAVMRLAIDPFPILLMDNEILYRYSDSMTEPYKEEFVEEYLGKEVVNQYKKTKIYQDTYNIIMGEERKSEVVFNIVKHKYIDSQKMDEILQQCTLISKKDAISVMMVYACEKVVKTYCEDGLLMYFTDRNTNRTVLSWSGIDFRNFAEAKSLINQPYDEAYISVFQFDGNDYWVEHNEKLETTDVSDIVILVSALLLKISESDSE